ncbi:hypothetical protein C8R45DRAFT_371809 [Mycena sanguinolenta]|nr:hypothetical protein C8R45DRAFT_371809 [Mycena sanguinolenta]
MAPELFDPDRFGYDFARTPATDVYAFGCVCLELYTGLHPFSGLSETAALLKVIDGGRPERPSSPVMSDTLWQHVTEFWAQDPEARPATDLVVQNMVWPIPSIANPQQNHGLERRDKDELTRKIGFLTATASEDWTLVLDICDHASASKANAKEAVRALRREFKYGEPAAQLAAARLWAIMLRNSDIVFVNQSTARKFLDTLEDLVISSRTSPVVRERVMEVIAAAAYASGSKKDAGFRGLWRRVKPHDKPEEGVPFDTEDAMFNPPHPTVPEIPGQTPPVGEDLPNPDNYTVAPIPTHHATTSAVRDTPPGRRHRSRGRFIPPDEDIRRLFQECTIGVGNANLLSQALSVAAPEILHDAVVAEFRKKCENSQELIITQIPWATAGAERSRAALDQEEGSNNLNRNGTENLPDLTPEEEAAIREQLLADLLAANAQLLEALNMYDDLKRVAQERERERELPDYSDIDHSSLDVDTPPFPQAQRFNPPVYSPFQFGSTDHVSPTQSPAEPEQQNPLYVYDPNRTYSNPNVQAWVEYYAAGGTDMAGAVYFVSVPGVTDTIQAQLEQQDTS